MMPQTATRLDDAPYAERADSGPIRIHTPPPRPVAIAEPPSPASNGIRPVAYLKYRWVTVVFLGGLLACIFAGLAWYLIPSKYTTSSMVRVLTVDPVIHSKEDAQGRNDFAIYLKSQAAMIRSQFVLTAALRDPNVAALPMMREQADPVRFLEEELKIEYQDGSEILKISLTGDDPRGISQIVNAVHEAYFREVVDDEITRKKARLRQLEDSINRSQEDVKRRHGAIKQTDGATMASDAIPGLSAHLAANQLIRLKEGLGKIEADIASWEAEKAALEKKLSNVADEVPPPSPTYLEGLSNDPKIQGLARKIESLTNRVDYLIKLSNDPMLGSVVELRQKIADAEKERDEFKKERVAEMQKSQIPIIEKKLKSDLERCKSALGQFATQKEKMVEAIEEYQKSLGQNGMPGEILPDWLRVDVRERSKIITEMLDKANLLRLEINAPPRVRDFQRAAVPMKKEMKKQILGTVLAGLMGFALVGLSVVLYESRVRRALTLTDVQKAVIGPIAGVLPLRLGPKADDAVAEAVEKTRTHLLQQFSMPGGKVVAVTSALNEEGKAYLASQLAESFALSGSRTLLIDFDLRTPSLHRLLKVENERGLCEMLTGKADFTDVQQILPNDLMFLPAGKWTANVRLALTSEQIDSLLYALRQQFDVVILNTHPLLSVAETGILCRNADGILLSVERYTSRLPLVARAHEKLASASVEAFGVVYHGATTEECLN